MENIRNIPGIYQIRCKDTGKLYIGSSKDLFRRKREHFYKLRKGTHGNSKLQNYYNKHGNTLVFEVILFCPIESLIQIEQFWLDNTDYYFNICISARNTEGITISEEGRKRMSEAKKEFFANGGEPWNKGRIKPEVEKIKISKALKEYYKENTHPFEGKTHTEEAKEKMLEANKNRKGTHHTGHNGRVIMMDKESLKPLKIFSSCGEASEYVIYRGFSRGNSKTIRTKIAESIKSDRNAYKHKWCYEKDLDQIKLDELLEGPMG